MLKTLKTNLSWDFLFARVNQAFQKRILFQVIYPALLIAVVVECLLIPTRGGWPWSYKDSIAAGLFLFAIILFVVFRRQAYAQRNTLASPLLLVCRRNQSGSVQTLGHHGDGLHWFTSPLNFSDALQVPHRRDFT